MASARELSAVAERDASDTTSKRRPARESDVDRGVAALKAEGWLLSESRLPPDLVADLLREYTKALEAKIDRFAIVPVAGDERLGSNDHVLADFRPEGGNHDLNRWNMHLPSRAPFLDSRLIADPEMMSILEALLGKDFVLVSLVSDTALPQSGFQNVHQDDVLLRITINVPLVDITPENGPTEIWPRTHRAHPEAAGGPWSNEKYVVDATEMERRRRLPSVKPCVPAGSFILRDHRLMHRGTPNRSRLPRPMLTLNYAPNPGRVPFELATNGVARLALALRQRGRRAPAPARVRIAGAGHTINRVNEFLTGSDRDYRRTIPRDVWLALSPTARHILRYAAVEGGAPTRRANGALGATVRLFAHAARNLMAIWRPLG